MDELRMKTMSYDEASKIAKELIRFSWLIKPSELDDDERSVWQALKDEGLLKKSSLVAPTYERDMISLLVHPVLRGVARVWITKNPYPTDLRLHKIVSEMTKEQMASISALAGCSVKSEWWTTFISPYEQVTESFLSYLIPTFVMTTMRNSMVVDFPELLEIIRRGMESNDDEAKQKLFSDYRNSALLVVRGLDARTPLYTRMAGAFNWFLTERGRRTLATVLVLGPVPMSVSVLSGAESMNKEVLYRIAMKAGLQEADPVTYKILGPETHVMTMATTESGTPVYRKIMEE